MRKKKHILVVDDEKNTLITMEFILEVAKYKVSLADNGDKALEKILLAEKFGDSIDLLITDIYLPGLSGLELIDKLLQLNINIPFFVITGYGSKELSEELSRKGCAGYFDKPVEDERLLSQINSIFQ